MPKLKLPTPSSLRLTFAIVLACACSCPAFAQPTHRARLSSDLADRLARRIEAPTEIIVTASNATVDQLVARYGARVTKRLQDGAVLEATGGQIDAISQDPDVSHLSGNATVYRMMAVTTQATGADLVWAGIGGLPADEGRGVTVAVIDSGVANHSALRDRIVVSKDFTGGTGNAPDEYGHGTHVAGIVAESRRDGYGGMAPGAWIANLRVLGADGSGKSDTVIEAIDWAVQNRQRYNIRVINLSLGHPVFESYLDDPLCRAAQRAVDAGIIVVAAAGNFGKTTDGRPVIGGVIAPGNTPSVLTVGAINTKGTARRSDDVMATYSSRGPTLIDGVLKPELVAPGNRIVAASATGSYLATTYPERVVQGRGQSDYIELSGTSMSAAVVSGAAALLLSARPDLTPAQVKAALQLTASRVPGAGLIEAGAGSVDVAAAVELVKGRPFQTTQIAGELIVATGFTYINGFPNLTVKSEILVWGNTATLAWRTATPQTFWYAPGIVDARILVWGDSRITSDILVWGDSVVADILVWGNILVWGDSTVRSDILVWGDSTRANILVWGDCHITPDILVWGD